MEQAQITVNVFGMADARLDAGEQNMMIRFEFKHGGFIECEIDVDQSWDQVATKIYESDLVIGEHDDCTVGFAFQTNELKSIRRVH